jgi:catalase-peroxidase
MGPVTRCLGALVPTEPQIWQDPVPQADPDTMIGEEQITALKEQVLSSGLTVPQLVSTAWASATTFRGTDKRGGANGARIRLTPQKYWEVNQPAQLAEVLQTLEGIQTQFNSSSAGDQKVSLADLIVLAGSAAIEEAAKQGGHAVQVPFTPGRTDATQDQTDVDSFAVLEPTADGFRNYFSAENHRTSEELLIDRAQMLTLTAPEMTVLVGGLRTLDANTGQTDFGVFTRRPGQLTTDFFVHLLDISTKWQKSDRCDHLYEGLDRSSGEIRWRASAVDLIFGSNSQLQAISEVYACADSQQTFVDDFVSAWVKVMNLDRFDLCRSEG